MRGLAPNQVAALPEVEFSGAIVVLGELRGHLLEMLLPRLHAAGTAAIVARVPAETVLTSTRWLADRLALPLLASPESDPVELAVRLDHLVHGDVIARGQACARLAGKLRGRMATPEVVVSLLREQVGIECAVVGADAVVLAGAVAVPPTHEDLVTTGPTRSASAERLRVVLPALPQAAGATQGSALWLIADLPEVTESFGNLVEDVLGIAAVALAGWAVAQRFDAQRDAAFKTSVLAQLLTSTSGVSAHLVEQSVAAGWRLDGWHVAVCLRSDPLPDAARMDPLTLTVERVLRERLPGSEFVRLGDGWVSWSTFPGEPSAERFDALVNATRLVVAEVDARLVAGVGRPRRGGAGLAEVILEAQELAVTAGHAPGRKVVEDARASPTRRLVMGAVADEETARRSRRLLKPLLGKTSPVLLTTLETYLGLESSIAHTANRLNVHRNTVVKRLDRIQQLMNLRLDDPEIRLALQIACRALR